MSVKIQDVYTSGGCDHLEIAYPEYGIFFVVNNNDCNIPKVGEDWGFCSYESEEKMNDGNYIDCQGPLDNFRQDSLIDFFNGYILAKGLKKDPQYFDLENVDFCALSEDIANICEPHVLVDALYFHLKTFTKDELVMYLSSLDSNDSYKITDYLEK